MQRYLTKSSLNVLNVLQFVLALILAITRPISNKQNMLISP